MGELERGFPGEKAGLQVGDRIVAIDHKPIKTWSELTEVVHASADKPLLVEWQRNGKTFQAEITPQKQVLPDRDIGSFVFCAV